MVRAKQSRPAERGAWAKCQQFALTAAGGLVCQPPPLLLAPLGAPNGPIWNWRGTRTNSVRLSDEFALAAAARLGANQCCLSRPQVIGHRRPAARCAYLLAATVVLQPPMQAFLPKEARLLGVHLVAANLMARRA